ncbi:MAG TPA: matrixin family metalloprotease, partial [Pyrinomonadaceae bacterium]|nr:matrixin family metalloprotease [Pyrinomonadaceae bacterium]
LLLALTAVGQGAHRLANGHLKIGISSLLYKKLDYIPKHEIDNAIYQAAARWSAAANLTLEFYFDGERLASPSKGKGDGSSVITISDNLQPDNPYTSAESPAGTRIFLSSTGEIKEADIVLNENVRFSTNFAPQSFDLQSVLLHEFGHLIGLGHSFVRGAAMYRAVTPVSILGEKKRLELTDVDLSQARSIYAALNTGDNCCGEVVIEVPKYLAGKRLQVWLENEDGKVIAAKYIDPRSNRIGGLKAGNYKLFAQSPEEGYFCQRPALVEIYPQQVISAQLNTVIAQPFSEIDLIGKDGVLGESALILGSEGLFKIHLALMGEPINVAEINTSSSWIKSKSKPFLSNIFNTKEKIVSAELLVEKAAPTGLYSISLTLVDGRQVYLPGVLDLQLNE